ncbi:50S ribosomal protein L4 [bacterium]|nr:50S ribosomal protein L4 [bacterium]
MSTIQVIDEKNKKVGEVSLAASLTEEKVNKAVLYDAVKRYLASKHHGTVRTKTRAEVNLTNKKVYRQKGTGNARHGAMKSAPFVGGGRVFGPKPRDYTLGMNKKVRILAIREAFKSRVADGALIVVSSIPLTEIKTSKAKAYFEGIKVNAGLVILENADKNIVKSVQNLRDFKILNADNLNVFDLLKYPKVVLTQKAFEAVNSRYLA